MSRVIAAIGAASALLAGCVSVSEQVARAPSLSSYSLCEKLAVAVLASSEAREAWASELQRRGENCQQYMPAISAGQQSNAAALEMLRQAQPRPMAPVAPMGNLLYQSTAGTVRYCVYDKGGQKVTLTQPQLAPCPSAF